MDAQQQCASRSKTEASYSNNYCDYSSNLYPSCEPEVLQAQEKLIAKRTSGKTTSWTEYCKICGDGVPLDNHVEEDGSLQAEKEEKEEANRSQKMMKAHAKPEEAPAPTKSAAVHSLGSRDTGKRRRKVFRDVMESHQNENFLSNKPLPGAVARDVIGNDKKSNF